MARQLVLWGPPIVSTEPGHPDHVRDLEGWVDKVSGVGITKLIGGSTTELVDAAHVKDIAVHPYVNYTAFPSYGNRAKTWGWSLEFLRVQADDPSAKKILERHHPIYDGPVIGEEKLEPFAKENPEFWSLTRDKRTTLEAGERRCMSLAFPEVRADQIQKFLDSLGSQKGADGIQVEFVLGNEDADGVSTYGYEDAVAGVFQQEYGKSPFDIPNSDPDWLRFRARYVTAFLAELRDAVKAKSPSAQFTITMIAGDPDDYLKVLQDWPAWLDEGIVDELYVWWRTDSDLKRLERQVKHVAEVVNGRVPFIAELSCYHPGSFQTPELMLEGSRVARDNGADAVGIYRTHGVDQLDYWDVLAQMAKL